MVIGDDGESDPGESAFFYSRACPPTLRDAREQVLPALGWRSSQFSECEPRMT